MMYLAGLILCLALGYLTLKKVLKNNAFNGPLLWCLSLSVGLGLCGLIVFITHLLLGLHQSWIPGLITLALCAGLFLSDRRKILIEPIHWQEYMPGFIVLGVLALFLLLEALRYPLGGWDAWSCWNLKAKFIYLGKEDWKDIFLPLLWRSNTHYPLLLPSINVFFFDLQGYATWIPMLNSIIFTLCSAGLLLFGIYAAAKQWALPLIITAAGFLIPFNITLSISQYSDICFGLYALAAFLCFYTDELALCAICLGLLSFTKTEGTAAALLLSLGIGFFNRTKLKQFLPMLICFMLPTFIFTCFMAPHNEAFINGFNSAVKPATWQRLQIIAVMFFYELISPKWSGIWILLAAGLIAAWKKAFNNKLLLMALFTAGYLGILIAYYEINTFFEIAWWVSNTLHRILAALLPGLLYWFGLALL